MKLKGMNFGHALNAPGTRGFLGETPFSLFNHMGSSYEGSTFVAKATTLFPEIVRDKTFSPKLPSKQVMVKPIQGAILRPVEFLGPGLDTLMEKWKNEFSTTSPYFISFISIAKTPEERILETHEFVRRISSSRNRMPGKFGVQLDMSYLNMNLDPDVIMGELESTLDLFKGTGIPVALKVSVLMPVWATVTISDHPSCDAIVCSDSLLWGKMSNQIDWEWIFGNSISPLAHLGGGELIGNPLQSVMANWVTLARSEGLTKPIVSGGGLLDKEHAETLIRAGVSAIELGSVSSLRPWRIQNLTRFANLVLGGITGRG